MYNQQEKIQCNNCDHKEVCSLTKEFIAAQQAVDNVCVGLGNHSMKYLRDFSWIKPVGLECVHFAKRRPTARDISEENSAKSVVLRASG